MTAAVIDRDAVEILVGFARVLRAAGLEVSPDRTQRMIDSIAVLGGMTRSHTYWAGRCTACASPDDLSRYDVAFAAYFSDQSDLLRLRVPSMIKGSHPDIGMRTPTDPVGTDQTITSTGAAASALEVLRHRDFIELDEAERQTAQRLVTALRIGGPTRQSGRRRPSETGEVDPGRTTRAILQAGGELDRLRRYDRVPRHRRLVFLLDVSGSMAPYAPWMIMFGYAAVRARRSTEVFTMGTRLTRITRELSQPGPDRALARAAAAVPDWSGGTRLGSELARFVGDHGRRGTARGAVVVIASDGWERGNPALLAEQMGWISRLAHRVVWVNPHRGRADFEPTTAGMAAALPYVDDLVDGSSIVALERLAALLSERRSDA